MKMLTNPKINAKSILDCSALIALLKKEPGYQLVESQLAQSAISTVNLCELVSILARNNIDDAEITLITKDIVPVIIPFCPDISDKAGRLAKITKEYGLSLSDRACLATAIKLSLPVYTADKIWQQLNIPNLEIKVIC